MALAQRVQELNRYRSDFFGRLREILSDRENIRIVGDRFVFQSEVLFPTGSEEINDAGKVEMKKLADAIIELQKEIPPEINWVLRVDGHTDNKPLSGTGRYRDNWELSTARVDLGGEVPDRERRAGQPAGRGRLRRVPAARRRATRRSAGHEPPHRAQADREITFPCEYRTESRSTFFPERSQPPLHDEADCRWLARRACRKRRTGALSLRPMARS